SPARNSRPFLNLIQGFYMLRTRTFWAIVLAIITCVLLFEARTRLPYNPQLARSVEVLAAPGTHLAAALNQPGSIAASWGKFWSGLTLACNFLIYVFFWYACIWITGYLRARQHPYDRQNQNTLVNH